ncbi:unnamed protein product [Phytomonas sp. EM1]|nr:unnamed protein product [Phytomonas sp. EM1]|eukprot:CCW61094.1 unnamed protein product [Phytomonas sp. isolate EM1]
MGICSCKNLSKIRKSKNPSTDRDEYGAIFFPTGIRKSDATHTQIYVPTEVSVNEVSSDIHYFSSPNKRNSLREKSSNYSNDIPGRSKSVNTSQGPLGDSEFHYQRKITEIYVNQNGESENPYGNQSVSFSDEISKIKVESMTDQIDNTDLYSSSIEDLKSLYSVNSKSNKSEASASLPQRPETQKAGGAKPTAPTGDSLHLPPPPPPGDRASIHTPERPDSAFHTPIEDSASDISEFLAAGRPRGYAYYNSPSGGKIDPPRPPSLPTHGRPPLAQAPEKFSRKSSITVVDVRSNRAYDASAAKSPIRPNGLRRADSLTSGRSDLYGRADPGFLSCRSTTTSISAWKSSLSMPVSGRARESKRTPAASWRTPALSPPSTTSIPRSSSFYSCCETASVSTAAVNSIISPMARTPSWVKLGRRNNPVKPMTSLKLPPRSRQGIFTNRELQKNPKPLQKVSPVSVKSKSTEGGRESGRKTATASADPAIVSTSVRALRDVSGIRAEGRSRLPARTPPRALWNPSRRWNPRNGSLASLGAAASSVHSSCFAETPRSSCFRSFPPTPSQRGEAIGATPFEAPPRASRGTPEGGRSKREARSPSATPSLPETTKNPERRQEEEEEKRGAEREVKKGGDATPTPRDCSSLTINISPATVRDSERRGARREGSGGRKKLSNASFSTPLAGKGRLEGLVLTEGSSTRSSRDPIGRAGSSGAVISIHDSPMVSLDHENNSPTNGSSFDLLDIISYPPPEESTKGVNA